MLVLCWGDWESTSLICCSNDRSKLELEQLRWESNINKFKSIKHLYEKLNEDCYEKCGENNHDDECQCAADLDRIFCEEHGFNIEELSDISWRSCFGGFFIAEVKEI